MTAPPSPERKLHVHLDAPLPEEVAVGAGTALFVCGWCFCPGARIRSLAFVVDGAEQPVAEFGAPRLDVLRELERSGDDPRGLSYRSGFWGTVELAPGAEHRMALRAELADGATVEHELVRTREPATHDPAAVPPGTRVAICMATHEPPRELLRRQLDSIRAQTRADWVCLMSDDASSSASFAALQEEVADDPRFVVSRSERRLGFYRNFERALGMVPRETTHVALADQDDVWHPDKLDTLLRALGDAPLVLSDARVIAEDGTVLANTWWSTRRPNVSDLLSVLVANSITGAASLFRRDLLDVALPFPPGQFAHFHDHWIGLCALALGGVVWVDRPLYDYVQHGDAVLGHAAANRMTPLRARLGALRRDPRERVRMWRLHYFVDVARLTQFASVLLMRAGSRMESSKRRKLERFVRADRSLLALTGLAARGARELVARRPETLGAEWMLAYAFAWRRLLSATARDRPQRGLRLDAVPPPRLALAPGRTGAAGPPAVRALAEKIAPLSLDIRADAPPRINILIPELDLRHLFGGYIAKLNLARKLAEHGHRVRIVTVDPQRPLPPSWRTELQSYEGLDGLLDSVEIEFGRESVALEVSPADRWVASTWWTAHIAAAAVRATGGERFLYLVQEYEPFTFPMGSYAAVAAESYRFPHFALFSSELLRGYFRAHSIGVYAPGEAEGDARSVAFENAITAVRPPTAEELAARTTRRLLFYARPEPHAARNMFELGLLALSRAVALGALDGWQLRGIGTVDAGRRLDLGNGAALELLPRAEQSRYADVMREHDVGLALMHTPHPSLVPIEMASAGMLTVTTSFENKTPAAMAAISPNIVTVEAGVEGIVAGLRAAVGGFGDFERRARGSHVAWSRDWDDSFGPEVLERALAFLA